MKMKIYNHISKFYIVPFWSICILSSLPITAQKCYNNFTDSTSCYIEEMYIDQPFTLEKKVESKDLVHCVQSPLSGDINGDCISELFAVEGRRSFEYTIVIIN